ncbi:FUSC family protein [Pedobacter sp. HMF7647]|uniref:FUSC family protein n=1 Tax=Hufsiella arboris TaxID=2695275 RepID=A0A7K1Y9B6_9SPHI|nr:FUSC family membrane protein [Hufsiella arboris]MXV50689.1 FUSC family protein [Hufsiella arboris]
MKYSRDIKNFLSSHYFSDGLIITVAVLLPSVILAQFGMLAAGINVSLGAAALSISDTPGPFVHKRNGMLICILFIFLTAFTIGLINSNIILAFIAVLTAFFFFSMFNIYGNRAASIGTAALLVLVVTIDEPLDFKRTLEHSLQLAAGGIWYFLLSTSAFRIMPYRLAQQALGECVQEVGKYIKIKSLFYLKSQSYDETYKKIINQQIEVNKQQDTVRELLFKTRQMVKESTNNSRRLVLVFVDVIDLFEQATATHYDYQAIRKNFGDTEVLSEFSVIIDKVGDELLNLSYYITVNGRPGKMHDFQTELEILKGSIDKISASDGENTLVLKKILINIRNIISRIQKIYSYYSESLDKNASIGNVEVKRFVTRQDYDLKILKDNISLNSATFRHSLRVGIVATAGFTIANLFPLGHHSYWILLTVLVIIKPGFSLTKQRNFERLVGTLVGGLAGAAIIFFVHDSTVRFALLLICMLMAYSFQRLNYIVSVFFMTPYILLMFSFVGLGNITIASERILDTVIGCAISFASSYLVFPAWEYTQIRTYMEKTLVSNYHYMIQVGNLLMGKEVGITEFKLARKDVYVDTANLASAFQRMLSEPKSKQKEIKDIHKFVVLNHILSSYIATLISGLQQDQTKNFNQNHIKLLRKSLFQLSTAIEKLSGTEKPALKSADIAFPDNILISTSDTNDSRLITKQLEFINDVAGDIEKISAKLDL